MKIVNPDLRAPFLWFGGKSRVAPLVWERFGDVVNYVEPFFGSGVVLLGRPQPFSGGETVNDLDGYICNFWRAVKTAPEEVAEHAYWPVNENDLHARHLWLVQQRKDLSARLEGDPDWYDPKIAGWWVWGICCWIGSGFCHSNGPWTVHDGRMVLTEDALGEGVKRQLPHLGDLGMGVYRQLPHLGGASEGNPLMGWFAALCNRLQRVRVCSGDWSRVCGKSVTYTHGLTGVFLDPPYDQRLRADSLYSSDHAGISAEVRDWAIELGRRDDMRIALCGYSGEHSMPSDWEVVAWKAAGGYGSQRGGTSRAALNKTRERIWFSPACLRGSQLDLFGVPKTAS